eukprot:m.590493 g.590493  ORF g.590493 m.590493 type:complete len:77 (+) comp58010_c0_seq27:2587-2817(+)
MHSLLTLLSFSLGCVPVLGCCYLSWPFICPVCCCERKYCAVYAQRTVADELNVVPNGLGTTNQANGFVLFLFSFPA